jgi:hypothetical protein
MSDYKRIYASFQQCDVIVHTQTFSSTFFKYVELNQVLFLSQNDVKLKTPLKKYTHKRKIRTFYDKSIANFQSYLREEVWD